MDKRESIVEENKSDPTYVNNIRNILGVLARPGNFSCGGVLEKAQLELSVEGVGKINLPLSYEQVQVLKSKCTSAPFGRGSETLVNKLVRDAWQIDAKDVTFNSEFDKLIKEKIVEIIPILMGESYTEIQQVESELYKLVYYEIGGHFVAHRDTEKVPGMFATLVIQLPSGHEGGALVVTHKGETIVFDFEKGSRDKFFFTAFFADCKHELRKVTAGHRLVLIYNLVHKNSPSTLNINNDPSNNENFITTMKKSIEEWKSDDKGPQYLALKLDHLYTNTNASFQNLKGKDKKLAGALCSCADIDVYLATLTKNEERLNYDEDFDPEDEEDRPLCYYTLHNFIGVKNRKTMFRKLSLDKNEMLIKEEYMFHKYEVRCKSEYEYTGNEGCNINYFYNKKALVFWPKSHGILISCNENFSSVLVNCKKLSRSKKEDSLEMLAGIVLYIEKRHGRAMYQLQDINKVTSIFEIMILFEDKIKYLANTFLLALIKPYRYFDSRKEIVGLPNINSAIALANLINNLSWKSLGNSVQNLVKECAVSYPESCIQLVISLISLGLQEQAINIVKVATPQITAKIENLNSEGGALWAVLLSLDIFRSSFDDFVMKLSKIRESVLIEMMAEMYKLLEPNLINKSRIKNCFCIFLSVLQDNGWKNLSLKSVTLLMPIVLFVDKFDEDISILHSFVQIIISHEYSSTFLKALLQLPSVVDAKKHPSIQLMVQKRLKQLDVHTSNEAKILIENFCEKKVLLNKSCKSNVKLIILE
ncbi:unnamed protein product [Meganyctiphanes norvegica]|uniref:Fe2OG dioxygenase domain-containing protein n=1 Tax=Meganyctiphanes norvegica TaxID=48144 RepID=A0AAV2QDG3_MEGNR